MAGSSAPAPTRVMTLCPAAGRAVFTGHRMRPVEREAVAAEMRFRCGLCSEVHAWSAASSWSEDRTQR